MSLDHRFGGGHPLSSEPSSEPEPQELEQFLEDDPYFDQTASDEEFAAVQEAAVEAAQPDPVEVEVSQPEPEPVTYYPGEEWFEPETGEVDTGSELPDPVEVVVDSGFTTDPNELEYDDEPIQTFIEDDSGFDQTASDEAYEEVVDAAIEAAIEYVPEIQEVVTPSEPEYIGQFADLVVAPIVIPETDFWDIDIFDTGGVPPEQEIELESPLETVIADEKADLEASQDKIAADILDSGDAISLLIAETAGTITSEHVTSILDSWRGHELEKVAEVVAVVHTKPINEVFESWKASIDSDVAKDPHGIEATTLIHIQQFIAGGLVTVDAELIKNTRANISEGFKSQIDAELRSGTAYLVDAASAGFTKEELTNTYRYESDDVDNAFTILSLKDSITFEHSGNLMKAVAAGSSELFNEDNLSLMYSDATVSAVMGLKEFSNSEGIIDPLSAVASIVDSDEVPLDLSMGPEEGIETYLKNFYSEEYIDTLIDVKDYIVGSDIDTDSFVDDNLETDTDKAYAKKTLEKLGYSKIDEYIEGRVAIVLKNEATVVITEALSLDSLEDIEVPEAIQNKEGFLSAQILYRSVKVGVDPTVLENFLFNPDTIAGVTELEKYIVWDPNAPEVTARIDTLSAGVEGKTAQDFMDAGLGTATALKSERWGIATRMLYQKTGKFPDQISAVEMASQIGLYNTAVILDDGDMAISAMYVLPYLNDGEIRPQAAIADGVAPEHLIRLSVPKEEVEAYTILAPYYDSKDQFYRVADMAGNDEAIQALYSLELAPAHFIEELISVREGEQRKSDFFQEYIDRSGIPNLDEEMGEWTPALYMGLVYDKLKRDVRAAEIASAEQLMASLRVYYGMEDGQTQASIISEAAARMEHNYTGPAMMASDRQFYVDQGLSDDVIDSIWNAVILNHLNPEYLETIFSKTAGQLSPEKPFGVSLAINIFNEDGTLIRDGSDYGKEILDRTIKDYENEVLFKTTTDLFNMYGRSNENWLYTKALREIAEVDALSVDGTVSGLKALQGLQEREARKHGSEWQKLVQSSLAEDLNLMLLINEEAFKTLSHVGITEEMLTKLTIDKELKGKVQDHLNRIGLIESYTREDGTEVRHFSENFNPLKYIRSKGEVGASDLLVSGINPDWVEAALALSRRGRITEEGSIVTEGANTEEIELMIRLGVHTSSIPGLDDLGYTDHTPSGVSISGSKIDWNWPTTISAFKDREGSLWVKDPTGETDRFVLQNLITTDSEGNINIDDMARMISDPTIFNGDPADWGSDKDSFNLVAARESGFSAESLLENFTEESVNRANLIYESFVEGRNNYINSSIRGDVNTLITIPENVQPTNVVIREVTSIHDGSTRKSTGQFDKAPIILPILIYPWVENEDFMNKPEILKYTEGYGRHLAYEYYQGTSPYGEDVPYFVSGDWKLPEDNLDIFSQRVQRALEETGLKSMPLEVHNSTLSLDYWRQNQWKAAVVDGLGGESFDQTIIPIYFVRGGGAMGSASPPRMTVGMPGPDWITGPDLQFFGEQADRSKSKWDFLPDFLQSGSDWAIDQLYKARGFKAEEDVSQITIMGDYIIESLSNTRELNESQGRGYFNSSDWNQAILKDKQESKSWDFMGYEHKAAESLHTGGDAEAQMGVILHEFGHTALALPHEGQSYRIQDAIAKTLIHPEASINDHQQESLDALIGQRIHALRYRDDWDPIDSDFKGINSNWLYENAQNMTKSGKSHTEAEAEAAVQAFNDYTISFFANTLPEDLKYVGDDTREGPDFGTALYPENEQNEEGTRTYELVSKYYPDLLNTKVGPLGLTDVSPDLWDALTGKYEGEMSDELDKAIKMVTVQAGIIGSLGGGQYFDPHVTLAASTNKQIIAGQVEKQFNRGEIDEATALATIKAVSGETGIEGQEFRNAGYIVPGLGTYLSFQDAQDSGWAPFETGFFVVSAALDALIIFTPSVRGVLGKPVIRSIETVRKITPPAARRLIEKIPPQGRFSETINPTDAYAHVKKQYQGVKSDTAWYNYIGTAEKAIPEYSATVSGAMFKGGTQSLTTPLTQSLYPGAVQISTAQQKALYYAALKSAGLSDEVADIVIEMGATPRTGDLRLTPAATSMSEGWYRTWPPMMTSEEAGGRTFIASTYPGERLQGIVLKTPDEIESMMRGGYPEVKIDPDTGGIIINPLGEMDHLKGFYIGRKGPGGGPPDLIPSGGGGATVHRIDQLDRVIESLDNLGIDSGVARKLKDWAVEKQRGSSNQALLERVMGGETGTYRMPSHLDEYNANPATLKEAWETVEAARDSNRVNSNYLARVMAEAPDNLDIKSGQVILDALSRILDSEVAMVQQVAHAERLAESMGYFRTANIGLQLEGFETGLSATGAPVPLVDNMLASTQAIIDHKLQSGYSFLTSEASAVYIDAANPSPTEVVKASTFEDFKEFIPSLQEDVFNRAVIGDPIVKPIEGVPSNLVVKDELAVPPEIISVSEKTIPTMLTEPEGGSRRFVPGVGWVSESDAEEGLEDAISNSIDSATRAVNDASTSASIANARSTSIANDTSTFTSDAIEEATALALQVSTAAATATDIANQISQATTVAQATSLATAAEVSASLASTITDTLIKTTTTTDTTIGPKVGPQVGPQVAPKTATTTSAATAQAQAQASPAAISKISKMKEPPTTKKPPSKKQRKVLPKPKGDKSMDQEYRTKNAHKAVAWKQGRLWIKVFPPYDEDSIEYSFQVEPRVNIVKGPMQGWTQILKLGGQVDSDAYDDFASWFVAKTDSDIIIGEQKTKLVLK